jgi:hypothetical protein
MRLTCWLVVIVSVLSGRPAFAACTGLSPSFTAASANRQDVVDCVSLAGNGDTINIPANIPLPGPVTWDASVEITTPITLKGAGQTSTVITTNGSTLLELKPTVAGAMRITDIGFRGTASFALILVDRAYTSLRLDHLEFTDVDNRVIVVGYNTWSTTEGPIYGLMDHIKYNSGTCNEGFALVFGKDLDAWRGDDRWGTVHAFYIEDSEFNWNITSNMSRLCTIADGEHGARIVLRHNNIKNAMVLGHDTGGTQQSRGQRIREVYSNIFTCDVTDGNCGGPAIDFRGGSQLVYDNTIPIYQSSMTPGYWNANLTQIWRLTDPFRSTGAPWNYGVGQTAKNVANDFRSHCDGGTNDPPLLIPFVACGANEVDGEPCQPWTFGSGFCRNNPVSNAQLPTGVFILSNIDGGGSGGYPARDQVGRGKDTGSPLGSTQTLTPAYWWNNIDPNNSTAPQLTFLNVGSGDCFSYPSDCYIREGRDVYMGHYLSFNGTSGIGRGTIKLRPSTCTPRVGYWATDTNPPALHVCTATDTWTPAATPYYKAFTYPHPLQSN